jgi:hypothetical protein
MIECDTERSCVLHFHTEKEPSSFFLDWVFESDASQEQIYQTVVAELLEDVLTGETCTLFMYGSRGSGKTFTLFGHAEREGVIPQAVKHLFLRISSNPLAYNVEISCLSLDKEKLSNLLVNPTERTHEPALRLRELPTGELFISDLQLVRVYSWGECNHFIQTSYRNQQINQTLYSAQKGTNIFILTIEGPNGRGKLVFYDLNSSHNPENSEAPQLVKLRRVVSALSSPYHEQPKHVPYRDSQLTRLLRDALSGVSKCRMIATISPADSWQTTQDTLLFAARVMSIRNNLKPLTKNARSATIDLNE